MKKRNANRTSDQKETPLFLFERYGLRASLSEHSRARGHTGHFVELEMFVETDNEWISIGLVSDTILQDAILLLQEAQEAIGKVNGVRPLPTVRVNGTSYFLDARLNELRNVDNHFDRIPMERKP